MRRLGAAVDAYLLKIAVEERLGYHVQLLSDGQLPGIGSDLAISEGTSASKALFSALARGEVDMNPEVTDTTRSPVVPRTTLGYSRALCAGSRSSRSDMSGLWLFVQRKTQSALDPIHRCGRP